MTKPQFIPMKDWGKDHWSLLLYVESRCVDYHGILDHDHMRDKLMRGTHRPMGGKWDGKDGTRLSGYFKEDGSKDTSRQLKNHDDHDCLEDLEAALLVKNVGSGMNPQCVMTDEGYRIITQLRKWKADGNHCATFIPA